MPGLAPSLAAQKRSMEMPQCSLPVIGLHTNLEGNEGMRGNEGNEGNEGMKLPSSL